MHCIALLYCWTGPALEEAVTPTVGEVIFTILVLAALPACYYYTPAGRRWIMLSFPEETFEGVKDLTVGEAGKTRQYTRAEVRANGSTFAKLLLVGYVAACVGFLLSQFPIAPSPPSPLLTRSGAPVEHDQSACFFDWTQYPGDNALGCTELEAYYSAGLKRDAETLNLAMFLIFGTAMFYSLWKSGRYSRVAALEIHHASRQLGRIHVATMSAHKHSVRSVSEVLETMDAIVRFERRKRTGQNWWHLFKGLVTWAFPTIIMGTAIRWSDAVLADGISYREGSVIGLIVVLCNIVAMFAVFYSMSHVFFTVAQHYEDTLERMRCLSTMLCPGPATGKGLPCIRAENLANLHGWIRLRRFIIRWSGRKHLENSQFAMGLLVPISLIMVRVALTPPAHSKKQFVCMYSYMPLHPAPETLRTFASGGCDMVCCGWEAGDGLLRLCRQLDCLLQLGVARMWRRSSPSSNRNRRRIGRASWSSAALGHGVSACTAGGAVISCPYGDEPQYGLLQPPDRWLPTVAHAIPDESRCSTRRPRR